MEVETQKDVKIKRNPIRKRKWIIYIIILILIGSTITLVYRLGKDIIVAKKELEQKIEERKKEAKEKSNEFDVDFFNNDFEFYSGTISHTRLENLLDEIVTNNKKKKNYLIEVIYENISYGTDANKITTIKSIIDSKKEYEVSFDYNNKNYINKVTIVKSTKVDEFDINRFNLSFKMYEGTKYGTSVVRLIDEVISNNNTEKEHLIEVIFMNTSYGTSSESIRTIKNNLDDWTKYEVILEYDEIGFVKKISIIK